MNYVQLFINNPVNAELDMDSSFDIALQYSIADIRDISKRNSAYSKTITLPGTKNNNYWFGNLYDVNSDFTAFNPNKKTSAKLLVNSETVIDGFLQLRNISKLNNVDDQGNLIYYECVIYNNAVDLMTELGEKTIDTLNLDEFSHTFSVASITQSWSNTFQEGYVYPIYGNDNTGPTYPAENIWPSVFYYTLLDRTLQESGYGWTGSLKTNEQFQKEIIAYATDGRPKIDVEERNRRQFKAGATSGVPMQIGTFSAGIVPNQNNTTWKVATGNPFTPYFAYGTKVKFDDDFTGDFFDNGPDNYSTTLFEWTCDRNGIYSVEYDITGTMELFNSNPTQSAGYTHSGAADYQDYRITFAVYIERNATSTLIDTLWPNTTEISPSRRWDPTNDGYSIGAATSSILYSNPLGFGSNVATFSVANTSAPLDGQNNYSPLAIGDKVSLRMRAERRYTALNGWDKEMSIRLNVTDTSYFRNKAHDSDITQGDFISLADYLPDKVKQKDLISDLIKRYNLYISVDPDNDKLLIMDPRPDYYDRGDTLDWTNKKDYSQEDQIQLLSELQFKEMLFTYKPDKDEYNEDYTAVTGDVYGQYKYIFDNDFVKGVKKIESPFSPTPQEWNWQIGAHLPAIDPVQPKIQPRILYYGGLTASVNSWDIQYQNINTGQSGLVESFNVYPYSGHWDDPVRPSLDINFGTPKYLFYNNWEYATTNNMYNRYWSNYISQIENGRLVTSFFYLDETDIRYIKENFNAKIFVKDSYYYVNRIIDYKPLEKGLTKVELIKIVEGITYQGQPTGEEDTTGNATYTPPGPVGPVIDRVRPVKPVRPFKPIKDWGYGNVIGGGGIVIGNNNGGGGYYSDDSSGTYSYKYFNKQFFFGDNNAITGNKSFILMGDNNTLNGDNNSVINGDNNFFTVSNVTLIQASGLTVSTPNQVYLGPSFSVDTTNGDVNLSGKIFLGYGTAEDPSLTWNDGFDAGLWKLNSGERQFHAGVLGITISTWDSKGINLWDKTIEYHRYNYRRETSDYTVQDIDYVIEVGGTSSPTITLPTDNDTGRILHIKNLQSQAVPCYVQTGYEVTGSSLVVDNFIDNGGNLQIDTNTAHGYATGSYVLVSGSGTYDGPYQIISIDSTLLFTVDTAFAGGPAGGETVAEVTYELVDGLYNNLELDQFDSVALCSKQNGNWIII